ncbi:MAG: PAS domain-containing protein [Alphaproteobacteria bacterium]|nr:PAS domain-containing protein [Alphaproteobacteria bacterium]
MALKLLPNHNVTDVQVEELDSPSQLIGKSTQHIYDWWLHFIDKGMPDREDFDIINHAVFAPNLYLAKQISPGYFKMLINGENVIRMIGANHMGAKITAQADGTYSERLAIYYQAILDHQICCRCRGQLTMLGRSHVRFESVDCPLSSKDGLGYVVGAMDTI